MLDYKHKNEYTNYEQHGKNVNMQEMNASNYSEGLLVHVYVIC